MSVYEQRLNQLTKLLKFYGLDYVVLVPGANLTYLTGLVMHLSERPTVAFFPAEGQPVLVLPSLEAPHAKEVIPYDTDFYPYADEEGHEAAFLRAGAAVKLPGKTVGVEYLHMRVLELLRLEQIAPNCHIQAAEFLLSELRLLKDETELARMREAVRITESAYNKGRSTGGPEAAVSWAGRARSFGGRINEQETAGTLPQTTPGKT